MEMARQIQNYRRFYASFNKLQKCAPDEDVKASLVSQYTNGRTVHLHEMHAREYTAMCKGLENMLGYGDQRKRHRSICLHLMQEIGVDTKDWQRINDFCQHPRISGKVFAQLDIGELEALELKLRAIKRKGGLKENEESEERRVKSEEFSCPSGNNNINYHNIIIVSNGTERTEQTTRAAGGGSPC